MRFTRYYGELGRPLRRVLTYCVDHLIFRILATKMSKLTAILRYVALLRLCLRLRSALHLSTSVAYLHSGTIRHLLTARCLSADYPGIQQMVLYSRSLYPSLPPPLPMSSKHLLTL
jgi:hypothetical protein